MPGVDPAPLSLGQSDVNKDHWANQLARKKFLTSLWPGLSGAGSPPGILQFNIFFMNRSNLMNWNLSIQKGTLVDFNCTWSHPFLGNFPTIGPISHKIKFYDKFVTSHNYGIFFIKHDLSNPIQLKYEPELSREEI